jgi:hypothetical protein
MLFRAVLLLAVAVHVLGQPALKEVLGLTEMQIWQLQQQAKPVPIAPPGSALGYRPGIPAGNPPMAYSASLQRALQNPILDASQQAKLAEIVKILDRWDMASEAIVAGLIDAAQWPGGTSCFVPHPSGFGLSDLQRQELDRIHEPLKTAIAQKTAELITSRDATPPLPPAEIARLQTDLSGLKSHWAVELLRSLSRAVLNDAQRARLAAFENDLKLVREAIDLKLIPDPPKGEVLCL